MEIIFIIGGTAIGVLIGILLERQKTSRLKSESEILAARLADAKETAVATLADKEKSFAATLADKEKSFTTAIADKENTYRIMLEEKERSHKQALSQQAETNQQALMALQTRFDETVAKLKAEISNLTDEMLKERQKEFESSSRQSVTKILEPLNNSIEEMRKSISDNTLRHTELGGKLSENIKQVLMQSDAARKSADRLADALRGSTRIQGSWGETVLTELLESQDLKEGIHFDTQSVIRDDSGNTITSEREKIMRPDVILHLDRDRDVVIDAKVSLSAFLDYKDAETDEARAIALQNHVKSVEQHVDELARKDYSSYIKGGRSAMNYVIMFIPNSTALYAATSRKPDLWRKAMEKGVYIADEQTLYAALKIISMTWRQIQQAENHEKVYALANEMLERVNMFMEKFAALGKRLEDAQKSYQDAFGKLKDGGQSIPLTCRKLIALGAKVTPRKGVTPDLLGLANPSLPE